MKRCEDTHRQTSPNALVSREAGITLKTTRTELQLHLYLQNRISKLTKLAASKN